MLEKFTQNLSLKTMYLESVKLLKSMLPTCSFKPVIQVSNVFSEFVKHISEISSQIMT